MLPPNSGGSRKRIIALLPVKELIMFFHCSVPHDGDWLGESVIYGCTGTLLSIRKRKGK